MKQFGHQHATHLKFEVCLAKRKDRISEFKSNRRFCHLVEDAPDAARKREAKSDLAEMVYTDSKLEGVM